MHANAAKTHCKRGHPLDPPNIYVTPNGGRQCRACRTRYYMIGAAGRRADRAARKEAAEQASRSAAEKRAARDRATQEATLARLQREAEALKEQIRETEIRLKVQRYCPRGHPIDPEEKRCKKCAQSFAIRRYYQKKKGA